jgi:hypothetical protein
MGMTQKLYHKSFKQHWVARAAERHASAVREREQPRIFALGGGAKRIDCMRLLGGF